MSDLSEVTAASAAPPARVVPFEPGIREDLPNEDYHLIDALSATGIKRILQSPMHYKFDRDNPREQTDSMLLGTALHMAILEPDLYAKHVVVVPEDAPKRPTAAQLRAAKPSPAAVEAIQFWEKFDRQAEGKLVLSDEQLQKVEGMAGAVRRHPIHDAMLCDGRPELSLQWLDARLGIPCKCRYDYLRNDGIALDLKTCTDASPDGFLRSVTQFKYHYQEAHYRNGHEHLFNESPRAFIFIAVENVAPYGCAAYVIEPNAIQFALNRVEEAMLLYKQARETGFWRGYTSKVLPLTLPRWAITLTPSY